MIRGKISSNIDDLIELNKKYNWIPNDYMIRPTEKDIELKLEFSNYTLTRWNSYADYVLHIYFKYPFIIGKNSKHYVENTFINEWSFDQTLFRYNLPPNVEHYILWNSFYDMGINIDDTIINNLIESYLEKKLKHNNFDFAWYKNPKPNVFELWHVQVFWIRT
jgi:hypothetical protein